MTDDFDDFFEEAKAWKPDASLHAELNLNDGQQRAVDAVELWTKRPAHEQMWLSITGAAGTGKTVVQRRVAGLLVDPFYTGMTGKAATRLRAAAGIPAVTLHKLLYMPPKVNEEDGTITFDELRMPPYGATLVIDEASMVTPQVAAHLRRWTNEFAVRILFIGDGFQLPPIVSKDEVRLGAKEDYSIFADVSGPGLTQVMRNGDAILDAATMLRTKHKLPTDSRGGYKFAVVDDAIETVVRSYLEDSDDHGLITWTNRTRMLTNQIIRSRRGIVGEIPQPGEPIVVRKNGGQVLNGEVYTIAEIRPGEMIGPVPTYQIRTTCEKTILAHGYNWLGEPPYLRDRDEWKAYRREIDRRIQNAAWGEGFDEDPPEPIPVTYGYALTAHLAQGSEFRRATVFMPAADSASSHFKKPTELPDGSKVPFGIRWFYTAATRAKSKLDVLVGRS